MDTTKAVTHISLCAGYGGIDLGLKRAIPDLLTVAVSEIEGFACANLVAKMEAGLMDAAPIWTDLKTFPWAEFRDRVDILTGGYPCQPFSAAGKRLGKDDPRHLWPYIADGIRILRPKLCFFENVEGHISLGLRDVIEELGRLGYAATWGIFSASEVGAPHQRKRVFVLAHRNDEGLQGHWRYDSVDGSEGREDPHGHPWPSRPSEPQHGWEPPRVVGDGNSLDRSAPAGGWQHDAETGSAGEVVGNTTSKGLEKRSPGCVNSPVQAAERGDRSSNSRQAEPTMGGDADGPTRGLGYAQLCVSGDNRTDELRLLGNGVVPATAALAFRTLLQQLLTH